MKKLFITGLFLAIVSFASPLSAQETRYKAIMLYQFTKLIGWPTLNSQPEKEFKIGIYGDTRIFKLTQYYCNNKKVGSHPIKVKYFNLAKEIEPVEILYISDSKIKYLPVIVKYFKNSPTLIVTSRAGALKYGSMANFIIVDGFMKVEINKTSALNHKLQISRQLENVAYNVIRP